ncbi:MAG TPA: hypothetical protein V6C81_26025 [Planktothrix sp.]|jgi:hypothetical protein
MKTDRWIFRLLFLITVPLVMSGCEKPAEPPKAVEQPVQPPPSYQISYSGDGDQAGTQVQVLSLKRIGDKWMKVKFAVINDTDNALNASTLFSDPQHTARNQDSRQASGVMLIGEPGITNYLVTRDSEDTAVCSQSIDDIKGKAKAVLWAECAAPPSDVQKMTVSVPHFAPVKNVPIIPDTPANRSPIGDGQQIGTRVQIESLTPVKGKWLKLQFDIINDSDQPLVSKFQDPSQKKDSGTVSGVTLIDQSGKTKYFVLRDMKDAPACSVSLPDLAPKSRVAAWAQFPMPPASEKSLTVLVPYFEPVDGVAITDNTDTATTSSTTSTSSGQ